MLTDSQLDDLQFGEDYAAWLVKHGMDYGLIIHNGDSLLDAQEKAIGFEEFLQSIGVIDHEFP